MEMLELVSSKVTDEGNGTFAVALGRANALLGGFVTPKHAWELAIAEHAGRLDEISGRVTIGDDDVPAVSWRSMRLESDGTVTGVFSTEDADLASALAAGGLAHVTLRGERTASCIMELFADESAVRARRPGENPQLFVSSIQIDGIDLAFTPAAQVEDSANTPLGRIARWAKDAKAEATPDERLVKLNDYAKSDSPPSLSLNSINSYVAQPKVSSPISPAIDAYLKALKSNRI